MSFDWWETDPEEQKRDEELRQKYWRFNTEAEITVRKGIGKPVRDSTVRDSMQFRIYLKLFDAEVHLTLALRQGYDFARAIDTANEVLQLEPRNSGALAIRAIAYSRLNCFPTAIQDAEMAIAVDPNDRSPFAAQMRRELPAWRVTQWVKPK